MAVGKYKPLQFTPINFSLTEGTQIPAPLDTPPETPRPPTPGKGPLSSHPTPKSTVFPHHDPASTDYEGSAAEDGLHQTRTSDAMSSLSPVSPTQKRPSSVRKFLGLRTLSSSDSLQSERPGSPATVSSQAPSLTRRKSGSWFGKKKNFTAGAVGSVPEGVENARPPPSNRTVSQPALAAVQPPKRSEPPPPALPELKTFGVHEGTLNFGADDMFKNIK
jgi:hypothetical protein